MKYTQTWIYPGGTAIGPASLEPIHNTFAPPLSYAYFCPIRGEVWARRICQDENGHMTRWHCRTVTHPDEPHAYHSWWPSGVLLTALDERNWTEVPYSVLLREFHIYNAWAKSLDNS